MRNLPLKIIDMVTGQTIKIKDTLMDFCKLGYCKCGSIPCVRCSKAKRKMDKVKIVVIDKTISC